MNTTRCMGVWDKWNIGQKYNRNNVNGKGINFYVRKKDKQKKYYIGWRVYEGNKLDKKE